MGPKVNTNLPLSKEEKAKIQLMEEMKARLVNRSMAKFAKQKKKTLKVQQIEQNERQMNKE